MRDFMHNLFISHHAACICVEGVLSSPRELPTGVNVSRTALPGSAHATSCGPWNRGIRTRGVASKDRRLQTLAFLSNAVMIESVSTRIGSCMAHLKTWEACLVAYLDRSAQWTECVMDLLNVRNPCYVDENITLP